MVPKNQQGFSILEVILAATMFVIFSTAAVMTVIQSYNSNRLGAEFTVANQFASEGLDAVRSIKNQGYANLVNTSGCGLMRNASNVWAFQTTCTNNTLAHAGGDNYVRTIKVESVNRDGAPPAGNIVSAGGTLDPDTKKITSTVTWEFNPSAPGSRPENISLVTYLSDWRKALSSIRQGIILYGDGTTTPKFRNYDSTGGGSFDAGAATIAGSSGLYFTVDTSPTKLEAIAGYINSGGTLQILCFDGTAWTNEWTASLGGTGATRGFDIAYETQTGNVMVVYSRGIAGTNALAYRTKPGTSACGSANWSATTNFATTPAATTGLVQWVRVKSDPRAGANNITAVWADSNSDLGINNWSGTAWATGTGTYKALETSLEVVASSQDVDNFDLAYESLSGNVMVVWGNSAGANGTNGARYSRCTGGVYTCSWTAVASVPTVSDDVHNIDLSVNPNTNQMVYAAIGDAGDDLTAAYWSGSAWTGYANLDTTTESPFAGSRLVSTAWLVNGSTTRWILNYDDATGTGLGWYSATPGSAPIKQTDFTTTPAINDIRERYFAETDPKNKNQALVVLTDSTKSIFAKKASIDAAGNITWTNADGSASLGTTSSVPQQGFGFAYWRNP